MDDYIDTSDYSGSVLNAAAAGIATPIDYTLPGDSSDGQQMSAWNTAPAAAQAAGVPWWAGAVQYGISKAVDNTFPTSPSGVMGNTYAGSTAGANGQTYTLAATGAGGGVTAAAAKSFGGIPAMYLLIGAAVLLFALR